jgi:hypothetical protein
LYEKVEKLHELCCEQATEGKGDKLKKIRMLIVNFPIKIKEITMMKT